jgi:hypothetical protein
MLGRGIRGGRVRLEGYVGCRIRLINLKSKRVWWSNPPTGYLGALSVDDPQVALMYAECILGSWGDVVVKVSGVDFINDPHEDLGGILVRGNKLGVLIEGTEMF